jgi:tripartite-type tricarboxylate transporter receptor subunit TctC
MTEEYHVMIRLVFTAFTALALMAVTSVPGSAQEWPQRTIKLMVGFGPGGGTDIVGRIIAQGLQEKLGQPVVVENKAGAGGVIAADQVARADKDGYTLYMMNNAHIIAGVMNKTLPYDTVKSFAPVGQVATAGLIIVTRPDFPASDVKGLVAEAKKNPGKITMASVGVGSTQHFTGELFKQAASIDMLHVPYRGSPAAIAAILGKQVDVLFETVSAVLGPVQGGEMKALAVTGKERFPAVPNVPAAIDSGAVPGYEVTTWYGVIAPAGTPPAIVARLNKALNEIVQDPAVRERLTKAGVIAQGGSAEAFGKHMASEFIRWGKVREAAGIPQQ